MAEWHDPPKTSVTVREAMEQSASRLASKRTIREVADLFYASLDGTETQDAITERAVSELAGLVLAVRHADSPEEELNNRLSSPQFWMRLIAVGFLAGVDFQEIND
jgi:hypothetical protein